MCAAYGSTATVSPRPAAASPPAARPQRGIQSIEVGGQLLLALVRHARPMALRDLAREAGMPAAKAHGYVVSYSKLGLVKQDATTLQYELGPFALQLGLAALQRLDPLKEAGPAAAALADRIGHMVAIAVRGNLGPTVVRIEESGTPIHVNMRLGTVMSLRRTATGRVFAAFLPEKTVRKLLEDDASRLAGDGAGDAAKAAAEFEQAIAEIRRRGMARVVGSPIPGINAFSAPVFDSAGQLALAITTMGPAGLFDPDWNGANARALAECARTISARLGHGQPAAAD